MKEETLANHWFWKFTLGKNRLFELKPIEINQNITIGIKVFYALLFPLLINELYYINEFLLEPITHPEWALFWTKWFPEFHWHIFFAVVCFFSNSITLFKIESRSIRIVNFILFFLFFSALNSYPKINHNLHTALIPLFFFGFIEIEKKESYQNPIIYATAIASLLISYSLVGLWKVLTAIKHLFKGDKGNFDLNAMSRFIQYKFNYGGKTEIGAWVEAHQEIGFTLLWSAILLEFLSFFILFLPKAHKYWGLGLILMHIGIANVMGIHSNYTYLSIVPLLLLSPFSKNHNFK